MNASDTGSKLVATVEEWREILLALDIATVHYKPAPDRWSIAEVLGHLVDSACNNHQRFVRAQESDSLTFPSYEQNAWVAAGNYHESDWPSLVEFWRSYNHHIARVMCHIPDSQLSTPCTITPNDPCTLEFLVVDYLEHLHHHLGKIRERLVNPHSSNASH